MFGVHKSTRNIKHYILDSFAFSAEQVHELLSCIERIEYTAIITCCGDGVLFFHTSHLHTHVFGFNDHHDTLWIECFLDAVLDLLGKSLLYLKSVAIDIHYTCNLAQSGNFAIWDISHMYFSIEWKNMMFAHREEINVLNDDHLVVCFLKECISQYFTGILKEKVF